MSDLIEITDQNEWLNILDESTKQPVLVFKHSTACPISASAYQEFISFQTIYPKYYVKVIESRPASNEIATSLEVTHQSPQIIIVQDKQAQWHTSHWDITEAAIQSAIENIEK